MERLPAVSKCYDQWLMLQGKVDSYYHDKPQERIPLSQQKEFRQIKNAIIQEAKRLHLGEITFEEKGLNQQDEPEEFQNASYDYWTLRDIIRDESLTMEERGEAVSEMERLAESGDMYRAARPFAGSSSGPWHGPAAGTRRTHTGWHPCRP